MADKQKVVFDTNIFISAIIFGGNPRQCLELARKGEIELIGSRAILLELSRKLSDKFLWEDPQVTELIEGLLVFTRLASPKKKIRVIKEEADNRILECALEGKANFIVSEDKKHLLSLEKFEGIPIVNSKDFLDIFYEK